MAQAAAWGWALLTVILLAPMLGAWYLVWVLAARLGVAAGRAPSPRGPLRRLHRDRARHGELPPAGPHPIRPAAVRTPDRARSSARGSPSISSVASCGKTPLDVETPERAVRRRLRGGTRRARSTPTTAARTPSSRGCTPSRRRSRLPRRRGPADRSSRCASPGVADLRSQNGGLPPFHAPACGPILDDAPSEPHCVTAGQAGERRDPRHREQISERDSGDRPAFARGRRGHDR